MSAVHLLQIARAAGLTIELDGPDLIVEADGDLPAALIAELRQHKAELITVLRPRGSAAVSMPDDLGERAALIEYGAGVPRQWAEGYAALCVMARPVGFSPERWQRIVDGAGRFMDRWAAKAAACGWSDLDVFGVDPDRPDRRFDCMGLLTLLDRTEIVAVDCDGADLQSTGALLRYHRRPVPAHTKPLWELSP